MVQCQEQTYDADLEVVARSTQEGFLLYDGLLWRHFLFD